MISKTGFFVFFFFLTLSFSQVKEELKNTLWEQVGYDRILKINDTSYTYFNVDKYNCSKLVQGNFVGRFSVVDYKKNLLVLNPGGVVNYRFRSINRVPKTCISDNNEKDNDFEINFESFWDTFNRNYGFFEERNIDWQEIYDVYSPRVQTIHSTKAFGKLLIAIVNQFNDGHIQLDIPELNQTRPKTQVDLVMYSKNQILDSITKKYLINPHSYNNGVIRWGITKNNNFGYIGIRDMNGFANVSPTLLDKTVDFDSLYNQKQQSYQPLEQFKHEINGVAFIMDKILRDFTGTKSIIIDLRFNGGGYETVSLKLLSYFVNEEKHIFSVKSKTKKGFTPVQKYYIKPSEQSRKKVYILTSPFSSSATEIFVLGSLSFDNFQRWGSKTNGIFSEMLWKQLPNGWEYSMSNEVYMDTNNSSYEGKGIDVEMDFGYSKNKKVFYNSFFNSDGFSDKLMNQIVEN